MVGEGIKWELFSDYWKPENNVPVTVRFENWRQEKRTYNDGKSKYVLLLEVTMVNGEPLEVPKMFTTSAKNFLDQIRPVIERAEQKQKEYVIVTIEKRSDKQYGVVDVELVQELARPRMAYGGVKRT